MTVSPAERLTVEVESERRDAHPRRFVRIELTYRVDGAGIDAVQVERAITLAFEKYCSVAASLAPDIVVETTAVVNGVAGSAVRQTLG